MSRWILSVVAMMTFLVGAAQMPASTTLAPFEIQLVNDKTFTQAQLKKDAPVIVLFFSPECDHCKDLTKAMLKQSKSIAAQVVMVTYLPLPEVKKFANEFSLQNYPNIKVGTEGMKLIVQKHYNIRTFPFVALYDKSRKLVKMYREQAPPADIVKSMQQLR